MKTESEILFEVRGGVGRITLNRPQALNALSHGMCVAYDARLNEWAGDERLKAVLIRGAGGRAFSAGGDLVPLYEARDRIEDYSYPFYRDEYRAIARLFHFSKPYIAFMDGIVMGAGVGLSVHGSHRLVTEKALIAMPETGIGLFPDVGATYFLPRCPGEVGMCLGLTGARLEAADALYAGLADYYVPSGRLEPLEAALACADLSGDAHAAVTKVLEIFAEDPGPPPLAEHREEIDRCFALGSVEEIVAALEREGGEWARATAAAMAEKSPTSLKLAYRQIAGGARLDFDDCMRLEYRLVCRCLARHDFYEGIRAALIDKDRSPKWRPDSLGAVSDSDVDAYFQPLGESELALPA